MIYREALDSLARQHQDRLKIVHTLTREEDASVFGSSVRRGRLGQSLLQECIPAPTECIVYVCGPGSFPHFVDNVDSDALVAHQNIADPEDQQPILRS